MKAKTVFGIIFYKVLAQYLPKTSSKINIGQKQIRALCGKLILENCGKNINIERKAVFSHRVILGDNSGIGINAILNGPVTIGNNVMMGPNCVIYTVNHKHERTDIPMIEQGFEESKPVTICDDVWIGGNVTILPGVTIGKGSIIGACAVVTEDVPDYSICCGNPGRIVKYRKQSEESKVQDI